MTQTTPERKPCGTCGNEYTVTRDGVIRHHFTENPDFQAGPDSRKCKGVGQPPAGAAGLALAEDMEADRPQCRLCKHPVRITGNGRAGSHLTPEQTPRQCPGGSDFPLGTYPDLIGTTDGLVATLAADCEHVPVGQCYGCHGAAGGAVSDAELNAMAEAEGTGAAPWGVDPAVVQQPTMADQFTASPLTALLERETAGVGTVLDAMDGDTRTEAEQFMGAAVPAQPTATRDPQCAKCDTDNHRCPGCGTDVPHGVVACASCTARVNAERDRRQAMCSHPDGFQAPLSIDGKDVPACGHCNAVEPVGPDSELPNCPHPETHRAGCGCPGDDSARREPVDGWRTPLDLMEKMPDDVRGLDALRLNCVTCSHSVTPLVESFDMYGDPKTVTWGCREGIASGYRECRGHECSPNTRVRLGELDEGDHFTRRGTLMRVTGETNGVVHAVVVDGPHKGRTGDLPNLGELVDREPCRHQYTPGTDSVSGEIAFTCEYCDHETKELEDGACVVNPLSPDDRTPQQRPGSSAAPAPTTTSRTTAPAPGSPRPTPASAPAVSPKSESVTSSAPTARAAGNGRSAAVTTDQSAAAAAFLGSRRPAAPVATGAQSPADAAAQFLAGGSGAHGEKETKRDRYGRYLIPHPDTGKEQAWTRATTFAKSISDTYALSQWGLRMALLGATMRPDILQRAHGKHVSADKALLDELTAELKNAAGDKVAANKGTAMHSFTELADRAWHSPGGPRSVMNQVPPDCREDVETYIRLLEETGLEPVPHLIEFTTVVKQYGVAGTSDNCYKVTKPLTLKIGRAEVRLEPGQYVIGDKKTGKDLSYGWQEIAIQLGVYAQGINTAGVWDKANEVWEPDPLSRFDKPGTKVRLDAGIVIHLPVDKSGKKQPAVYGIDLESGWNAAVLCERVRAWRNVRTLASPVMVSEADTFAPSRPEPTVTTRTTVRPPSLMDKALAVTSKGDASAVWKEALKAGLPKAEVDELVDLMQKRLKELAEPGG